MNLILKRAKPLSIFLTIMMLSLTVPYQPVLAAMVGTETIMDSVHGKQARDKINNLLLRQDVQNALKAQGIDPLEAKARIDSLSDAEVTKIADQIDKIPSGSGAYEVSSSAFITPAIIIGASIILIAIIIIIYLATSD